MEPKEFAYFNKSDRSVIIVIIGFVVVVWLLILLIDNVGMVGNSDCAISNDSTDIKRGWHIRGNRYGNGSAQIYYEEGTARQIERFAFDPNTADSAQLLRLGLQPWQVRSIYRYRAAGGVFSKSSDFARVRGLTKKQYHELEPYITIAQDFHSAKELLNDEYQDSRDTVRYPRKITLSQRIAVNTADTNMLRRIPGIGIVYAKKIVAYRQRLGGFVDLSQLKEIDGFPESALQYMCIPDGNIRKVNVNKLTLNQLKTHPYINFYQARAIVEYRRQRGPINDISDLSIIPDFPPEVVERLRPYMEY